MRFGECVLLAQVSQSVVWLNKDKFLMVIPESLLISHLCLFGLACISFSECGNSEQKANSNLRGEKTRNLRNPLRTQIMHSHTAYTNMTLLFQASAISMT